MMHNVKKREKYKLFNVNVDKAPITKKGYVMLEWELKTYNELLKEHNYNSNLWGLSLGIQENGKYILSLDFDIYLKASNSNCIETEKLLGQMNI